MKGKQLQMEEFEKYIQEKFWRLVSWEYVYAVKDTNSFKVTSAWDLRAVSNLRKLLFEQMVSPNCQVTLEDKLVVLKSMKEDHGEEIDLDEFSNVLNPSNES